MDGHVHPDFGMVTEKLAHLMGKRKAVGGAAVAVYHRGELVVDVWTGVRDAAGTPWERDTMAMSFSTTKGVVATVVAPSRRSRRAPFGDTRFLRIGGAALRAARRRDA